MSEPGLGAPEGADCPPLAKELQQPARRRRPSAAFTGRRVGRIAVGVLLGAAVGTGGGWTLDDRAAAEHRSRLHVDGGHVQTHVAMAERSLLSSLVQGPFEVEASIAAAQDQLQTARDELNSLVSSAQSAAAERAGQLARTALNDATSDADQFTASLRSGNFGATMRIGAKIAGDPTATDDNATGRVSPLVASLVARLDDDLRTPIRGRLSGGILGGVGTALALEHRRRTRRLTARTRLRALAQQLEVVEPSLVVLDRFGRTEYSTGAAESVLGAGPLEPGTGLVAAAGPEFAGLASSGGADAPIAISVYRAGRSRHIEASTPVLADDGQSILWVVRDVTEERSLHGELTRRAFHDPLTLLPNRERFRELLQQALETSPAEELAVLFLDLDGFKTINDNYGHDFGDRLLVDVSGRLQHLVHTNDLVGRLGGDEFAIILTSSRPRYAEVIAEQIVHALAEPFIIEGRTLRIGGSVGYTAANASSSVEELLQQADVAMYSAKDGGKGRTARFDPEMLAANRRRMTFERDLRGVASSGQLRLLYQPVVELATRRMVGMEALVRWLHPERGLVSPLDFITAAEDNGSIVEIGRWVLRTGLTEFGRIPAAYALRLNVNLSPRQLCEPDFVNIVASEIDRSGVPAASVTFEVTESLLLADVENGIARLHELKSLGVKLALDDFGTGYSSLSYLARLPVDVVKIDKSFIDQLRPEDAEGTDADDPKSRKAFVGALVSLAHARDLTVVAEGIEHEYQVDVLQSLGCEFGQGYLFAKPLSASSLTAAISPAPEVDDAYGFELGERREAVHLHPTGLVASHSGDADLADLGLSP